MRVLPVILVLLALPLAHAQEHGHAIGADGLAAVLYDGPPGGRAITGSFTHFGFALLDQEGKPIEHQNAAFEVVQNGEVLFHSEDTHEYDGLFSFDVRFVRPGPYEVHAMSGEMTMGVFAGEAVAPMNAANATVLLEQRPLGPESSAFEATLSIVDEAGRLLNHTDAVVELRGKDDGRLAARTHLHIHDEPIVFTQGLRAPGEYVMMVIAYKAFATGRGADVPAVVAEFPVTAGALALPALPSAPMVPAPLAPIGQRAEGENLTLQGTYDPQNQVGVGQLARIAALVTDSHGLPKAHVDFRMTLQGPRGIVFQSGSLHEYDGVLEYAFVPAAPGLYAATITASDGDEELTIQHQVEAIPPIVPLNVGPGVVRVEGLDGIQARQPVEVTFDVAGPAGPVAHSEVEVTVSHHGEAPIYQFKLHTHDSGQMRATLVLPHDGHWSIRVDPLPTTPDAVTFEGPDGPGAPIVFEFEVAPADAAPSLAGDALSPRAVPLDAALVLLGLVGAALVARRGR